MGETRSIDLTQRGDNNVQFGSVTDSTINITYNTPSTGSAKAALGTMNLTRPPFSREYYNLFVIGGEKFDCGHFTVSKSLSLTGDFIEPEVKDGFFNVLDDSVIARILSFPSLFADQNADYMRSRPTQKALLGRVTGFELLAHDIKISFAAEIQVFQQSITDMSEELKMLTSPGQSELNNTHWTIKQVDIIDVLTRHGLLSLSA